MNFRAKRKKDSETVEEKRQRLQGRKAVGEDKNYYKQFACKRFKSGKCEYGDDCKYSHDVHLYHGTRDNQCNAREETESWSQAGTVINNSIAHAGKIKQVLMLEKSNKVTCEKSKGSVSLSSLAQPRAKRNNLEIAMLLVESRPLPGTLYNWPIFPSLPCIILSLSSDLSLSYTHNMILQPSSALVFRLSTITSERFFGHCNLKDWLQGHRQLIYHLKSDIFSFLHIKVAPNNLKNAQNWFAEPCDQGQFS